MALELPWPHRNEAALKIVTSLLSALFPHSKAKFTNYQHTSLFIFRATTRLSILSQEFVPQPPNTRLKPNNSPKTAKSSLWMAFELSCVQHPPHEKKNTLCETRQ